MNMNVVSTESIYSKPGYLHKWIWKWVASHPRLVGPGTCFWARVPAPWYPGTSHGGCRVSGITKKWRRYPHLPRVPGYALPSLTPLNDRYRLAIKGSVCSPWWTICSRNQEECVFPSLAGLSRLPDRLHTRGYLPQVPGYPLLWPLRVRV
jgi:hypothetical protein